MRDLKCYVNINVPEGRIMAINHIVMQPAWCGEFKLHVTNGRQDTHNDDDDEEIKYLWGMPVITTSDGSEGKTLLLNGCDEYFKGQWHTGRQRIYSSPGSIVSFKLAFKIKYGSDFHYTESDPVSLLIRFSSIPATSNLLLLEQSSALNGIVSLVVVVVFPQLFQLDLWASPF